MPTPRRTSPAPSSSFAAPPRAARRSSASRSSSTRPYFCKSQHAIASTSPSRFPARRPIALQALAKELAVVLVVPMFERQAAGVYRNSAAIIDADGALLGVYRKMHIPDDPLFNEKYYFTPGDAATAAQAMRHVARRQRLPGLEDALRDDRRADLLGSVVSRGGAHHEPARRDSAVLSDGDRLASRRRRRSGARRRSTRGGRCSARTRSPTASTSRRRTASATRTSRAPTASTFFGHSFIADPFGRIIAEARTSDERSSSPTLRPGADRRHVRRNWPFLRDRRIDAYGPILSRYLGA